MAGKYVVQELINEIGVEVGKNTYSKINRFEKRLEKLKKTMKGMSGSFTVRESAAGKRAVQQVKHKAQAEKKADAQEKWRSDKAYQRRKRRLKKYLASRRQGERHLHSVEMKNMREKHAYQQKIARDRKRQADRIRTQRGRGRLAAESKGIDFENLTDKARGRMSSEQINEMKQSFKQLNSQVRRGQISIQQYNNKTKALFSTMRRQIRTNRTLGESFNQIRSSIVAMTAAYSAFAAGAKTMRTGQMFESMEASMLISTDQAKTFNEQMEQAGNNMDYVVKESRRLGLDLGIASDEFVKLAVTGRDQLTDKETKELFTGISEYSTAMGLGKFRYQKSISAVNQMLNKQQVMA